MLPKLSIPKFDLILPSTGKKISLRPYLVKEQKILLMAQFSEDENEIVSSIKQIINNCLLTEGIDVETLPLFDIEYLFLKLRAKSVGEQIELSYKCTSMNDQKPCNGIFNHTFNIEELEIKKTVENNNVIILDEKNKIGIELKFPTYETFTKYNKLKDVSNLDKILNLVKECTKSVFSGDDIISDFNDQEFNEWVETLSDEQFTKIIKFFETIPKLNYEIDFKCPKCNASEKIVLSNLTDFFV